ncbi:MAG: dihydrodipicolinate synthase family protein [Chloroflexi bacterium]|nr:dihydrodipicolinate synthase family protein [Chloroflexota bacterium]
MKIINGVFAAAVTPLTPAGKPETGAIADYMGFLAERGCHGALLLGTTGEGPSFSRQERELVWEAATRVWQHYPEFVLLAGTGSPSLDETIELNKLAFNLGYEAVVVLPPYYFRQVGDEGLFAWFSQVIEASVPEGKQLLGYHIPVVSGVGFSFDLLAKLAGQFPENFGGLKDSSGNLDHSAALAQLLKGRSVLVGNDRLFGAALSAGASGCITALANLFSPQLRRLWDEFAAGQDINQVQSQLDKFRAVLDELPPAPSFLKAVLAERHRFSRWPVRLPLEDFSAGQILDAKEALSQVEGQ